jgi:hypothetical protein
MFVVFKAPHSSPASRQTIALKLAATEVAADCLAATQRPYGWQRPWWRIVPSSFGQSRRLTQLGKSRNQGSVRYMHAIIARTEVTQTHASPDRHVDRPGSNVARKPSTSAPVAAVAVQPYQYIAGATKPMVGSAISLE